MVRGVKKAGKLKKGDLLCQFAHTGTGKDGMLRNKWRWEERRGWGGDGGVWDRANKAEEPSYFIRDMDKVKEERGIGETRHHYYRITTKDTFTFKEGAPGRKQMWW